MSAELRTQILNTIKEGKTVVEAAAAHGLQPRTIVTWMRKSAQSHSSELVRMKRENEFLRSVILDLVLEQKAANRKG